MCRATKRTAGDAGSSLAPLARRRARGGRGRRGPTGGRAPICSPTTRGRPDSILRPSARSTLGYFVKRRRLPCARDRRRAPRRPACSLLGPAHVGLVGARGKLARTHLGHCEGRSGSRKKGRGGGGNGKRWVPKKMRDAKRFCPSRSRSAAQVWFRAAPPGRWGGCGWPRVALAGRSAGAGTRPLVESRKLATRSKLACRRPTARRTCGDAASRAWVDAGATARRRPARRTRPRRAARPSSLVGAAAARARAAATLLPPAAAYAAPPRSQKLFACVRRDGRGGARAFEMERRWAG